MNKDQQETLLQTIRGNLKRMENGSIGWETDPEGKWALITAPGDDKPYGYFQTQYQVGIDPCGNPLPVKFMLKGRTGRTFYAMKKPSRWQRLVQWLKHLK